MLSIKGRGVKYWPAPDLVSLAFFSNKPSYKSPKPSRLALNQSMLSKDLISCSKWRGSRKRVCASAYMAKINGSVITTFSMVLSASLGSLLISLPVERVNSIRLYSVNRDKPLLLFKSGQRQPSGSLCLSNNLASVFSNSILMNNSNTSSVT